MNEGNDDGSEPLDFEDLPNDYSRGRSHRGSTTNVPDSQDPLFRKLMMWSWSIFGTIFMGLQVWLVSNVADIKAMLPRMADKDAQIDAHLSGTDRRVDKLEDRYEYINGKLYQYEGKNMRGPPEAARVR